jgi:glycosyltransferase involved in cell wall biosynthesis
VTRLAVLLEQCLAPVPGGTGRYSREIAAALAGTAPAGWTVTGWTAYHRDTTPARLSTVDGPHRLPLPRRALVAAWERHLGPAPRGDVVHAPTPLAPPRGVAWHRRMVEYAARVADRIVVPTHAVAAELAAALPIKPDRLVVVGEGVSAALRIPADADERAARLDLPGGYLLSLATLEPRKGLDVLLAALAHPDAPDLPLLVVGQPGWGGVDPLAAAARLGLPPGRLRVLGRIGDADLAVVLSRATALAAPSRAEGFGLPLLEAMAAGVPVVSSDAPALVEVGGGAAVVVAREDPAALAGALAEVARDAAVRGRLIEAGRRRAAAYTWEGAARTLWAMYAELV